MNAACAFLANYNTLESLPSINTRTLLVAGRHDGITPPGPGAERMDGLLPNSTLAIFEESGHYPFIEQESAFFDTLGNWLAP